MNDIRTPTIAMDCMGGDNGLDASIEGAILAAREFGDDMNILLIGREKEIKAALSRHSELPGGLSVHHAEHVVAMSDAPADAVRRKNTSIAEAMRLHKQGVVDAVVSPGNTGAVMASAVLNLGRLREVKRPAIATFFPNLRKSMTVLLDVGANSDCKPIHLYQFAIMGSIVAGGMFGVKKPALGLLSIGEEKNKGNELILETHGLLSRNRSLNFIGNVEGRDILQGKADVVVTDGFVGNVLLKFAESIEGFLTTALKRQITSNLFSRFGAILMAPFLRRLRNTFDYSEYGGAPLLGVNGTCIICHGSSSGKAIKKALMVAHEMVAHQVNQKIEEVLTANSNGTELLPDREQDNVPADSSEPTKYES
jgi:glycerol-3-phosphate acyltransferase PlsX